MAPKGPYKLVTVNNAPDRAKMIVGRVVEAMKEEYTIVYEANAESELEHNIVNTGSCADNYRPRGGQRAVRKNHARRCCKHIVLFLIE